MGNKQDSSRDFDMRKAMELAGSPAGQKLLSILQTQGGSEMQRAMEQASGGDYASAKQSLSALMEMPEVRKLLKQLEGGANGGNGR